MTPGEHQRSKQRAKIYVGRSTKVHTLTFVFHSYTHDE